MGSEIGSRNLKNLKPVAINEYTEETRDAPPAHLLTEIDSFSLLSLHLIGILESTEFAAGDCKWKVIVNLGIDISVKLCLIGAKSLPAGWEVNVLFNFFLYNHISDKYHCFRGKARRFHAMHSEWEFSKLITKDNLIKPSNGFLIKDKCVIGAEVFVIKNQPLIEKVSAISLIQPYKEEWHISNFSKRESVCRPEDLSTTKGNKWNLLIYPNESSKTCHRYASLFTNGADSKNESSKTCYQSTSLFTKGADSKTSIRGKRLNAASFFCFRNSKLNDNDKKHEEEYSVEIRDTSPAHLLTKIEYFSLLSEHNIKSLKSAVFEAGGYKWKVKINIDGGKHISAYLCMVETSSLPVGWEVNAMFNFFLYNHISDKYHCFQGKARRFHAINSEWGFFKFITKKSLKDPSNGYISADKCVFGAEVFVIQNQPLIEKVSVFGNFGLPNPYKREWKISGFSKLQNVWKSEEFSVGGYKWEIMMYPKGSNRTWDRYVSIYIQCVDAKEFGDCKKINAAGFLCFGNKLDIKKKHSFPVRMWFSSASPSWGFSEFKAIADMRDPSKGFVVHDCCILEIQLSVVALQELV